MSECLSGLRIDIDTNNICTVVTESIHGLKRTKKIQLKELVELLTASVTDVDTTIVNNGGNFILSEIFPGDSIVSTIQTKTMEVNNAVWYILARERKPTDIVLFDKKYTNCGMPKMLFAVKVSNMKCVSLRIACVKEDMIKDSTEVYKYPFSNVFETSNVCLGQNSISDFTLNSITNISLIPEMFLKMKNNKDGYHSRNSFPGTYEELLDVLEENDFDEDLLVRHHCKNYSNFIMSLN